MTGDSTDILEDQLEVAAVPVTGVRNGFQFPADLIFLPETCSRR